MPIIITDAELVEWASPLSAVCCWFWQWQELFLCSSQASLPQELALVQGQGPPLCEDWNEATLIPWCIIQICVILMGLLQPIWKRFPRWNPQPTNHHPPQGLTVFLVAVLVGVCVAILVTVCLGESCDSRSFGFSWRLVQKLLQPLLIQLTGRGWKDTERD